MYYLQGFLWLLSVFDTNTQPSAYCIINGLGGGGVAPGGPCVSRVFANLTLFVLSKLELLHS